MDSNQSQSLNPWFTMLTKPRQTIQQIVDEDPNRYVLLLGLLGGGAGGVTQLPEIPNPQTIQLYTLLLLPLMGVISIFIYAFVLRITGKWLGGQASPYELRAVVAWSYVLFIWSVLLLIPQIALFGSRVLLDGFPKEDQSFWVGVFYAIDYLLLIWYGIIVLRALSQVQQFSVWRAILNTLLSVIFVWVGMTFFIMLIATIVLIST